MPFIAVAVVFVVIIISLIAGITLFASNTIGRTVLDQFNTQQLQLVTSVAQQSEAYFSSLNVEIINLAQQNSVQAVSRQQEIIDLALATIAEAVQERPEVLSVTRFSFRGEPRFAYPAEYQALISSEQEYPVRVPVFLVERTASAAEREETVDFAPLLYRAPDVETYLLITPVSPTERYTEFLVYELDLNAVFSTRLDLVLQDIRNSESGQLWVLNASDGSVVFQARPSPDATSINNLFSVETLQNVNEPQTKTYSVDEVERTAALATGEAIDQHFVFLLSRDSTEASQLVQSDLNRILVISLGLALFIFTASGFATFRITRETRRRHEEAGLRRTSRALLEVSRTLNATLDLETVLPRILIELETLMPYYSASILLLSDDGLSVAAHRGADQDSHQRSYFTLDEARAAREVINTGKPVIVRDTYADPLWTVMPESKIRSWLGLPLRVFDRYVGVLNINSDKQDNFSPQVVDIAEALADQASVALQNARRHEAEVKRIEQEFTVAKGIQESLLPKEAPTLADLEVAWKYFPARQVSGDFFQIISLPDDNVGIFIGDVTGKGMPAAMIMAVITTALRDEITKHADPGELLNSLNARLLDRLLQNQMNGALLTAILNHRTHELAIANAGMVQPYVWLPSEQEWDWIDVGGYPLGASQHTNYKTKKLRFETGATLVLFSDGIIEAQNARGEFFGFERLEALLQSLPSELTAEQIKDIILNAVDEHLGDEVNQDDVTLMVVRALPASKIDTDLTLPSASTVRHMLAIASPVQAAAPTPSIIPEPVSHLSTLTALKEEDYLMPRDNVELFLPSTLGYEKVARNAAAAVAREMGFSEDRIEDLMTAVAEACMNAIEHGNQEDRSTSVTVLLSATDGRLDVRIEDRGRRRIPDPLPPPGGTDKSRGWGMFFIQSLMDEVEIKTLPEGGNLVKMTIYLNAEDSEHTGGQIISSSGNRSHIEPTPDSSEWVDQGD